MTDADEKAAFDPQARFIARDGVAYENFAAYLVGKPDPGDWGNFIILRYRKEGRSEAFCRVYRDGYDQEAERIKPRLTAPHEVHRQAGIRAFAAATKLHGEYHES